MKFELATAARIVFGRPLAEIGPELATFEPPFLLVVGRDVGRAAVLRTQLEARGPAARLFHVAGEPTLSLAEEGAAAARQDGCRTVVAMGGGSVLDAGKAIAALTTNPGPALDYVEVIGRGRALTVAPLPCVAIPTTAGTGSEVTRNAVLGSPEHRVKVSLRSPLMLPRLAWIDPELCVSMPPAQTAASGMDALSQVLEAYVCRTPNVLLDPVCREALSVAASALPRAFAEGTDLEARRGMSYVSLVGGLALANARLGAVHGFAAPLGGMYEAPHGALCAALLAPVMAANLTALRTRAAAGPALARYADVARCLTGQADAEAGVAAVEALCRTLQVAPLRTYGVVEADFDTIAARAAVASSMQGNPIELTAAERLAVLGRAF